MIWALYFSSHIFAVSDESHTVQHKFIENMHQTFFFFGKTGKDVNYVVSHNVSMQILSALSQYI